MGEFGASGSATSGPTAAAQRRPRVLVLDEELPWPADTGKKIRTLNLLRRLAGTFEIEVLVHDAPDVAERAAKIEPFGLRVHVSPGRLPGKRGLGFAVRLAANLASRDPYSVASHHRVPYSRALTELLATGRFDLVHCEWTPYARYLDDVDASTRPPVVVAAHNVEAQIWARLAAGERSIPRRAFVGLQARRMDQFERRVFGGPYRITAVSEADARRIREMGGRRVHVVPNGVDTAAYPSSSDSAVEPGTLVFTGSMDWRPNQEGIEWYLDTVRPHMSGGGRRLLVVGRNPPIRLQQRIASLDDVELTGSVPEVQSYLARAETVIVPLRSGGGSRLKILEAFAAGRPVVSTTVGAEGLDVEHGRHLLLADEPGSFAEAIERAAVDTTLRRRLIDEARRLVEAHYDWGRIAAVQAAIWQETVR